MKKHLPKKKYFLGKTVPDLPGGYIIAEHKGSGVNAHVFRAHSEEMRHDIAVKVLPRENLKQNWKQEFQKANILRSRMVVKFISISEWRDPDNQINCVLLLSDFVHGNTLREYIRENKNKVLVDFIVYFLEETLDLFHELNQRGYQHGDLHSGNILLEDQTGSILGPQYAFRVTDFGVTTATESARIKDDYENLAVSLKQLLENVDYQQADSRERFTFNILNDHFLAKHLLETDTTHDLYARRPDRLFERLREIGSEFERIQSSKTIRQLSDPFDYLSCEQLGESHSLLNVLYSDRFLGLSDVERRGNLVLTGPRGCGKSTVFKSLSLKHRAIIEKDDPSDVSYVGIYYRCDDLYFAFSRYEVPSGQEGHDVPMHFVTATLLIEMLDSIRIWAERHFKKDFEKEEESISKSIWDVTGIKKPQVPGADTFRTLSASLQRERIRAANKQRFVNDPKHKFGPYFGPDVLINACAKLVEGFSFLRERPFFCFIDDYSSPKITLDLQRNLNRLFMQRSSFCFFKLSTESPVSYERSDIDNKAYVEGREFDLLNLGLVYIHANLKDKLRFIEDVFGRRLSALKDYPVGELEDLVGSYDGPNYNEAAILMRDGKRPHIWGKQSLCSLCSGDIHHIIDLVRLMVSRVGGREGLLRIKSLPRIPPNEQTASVREQAGNFLKGLRISPNGDLLVEIVTAFGIVANAYLKFKDSKNVKGKPPWQAHRIEPYDQLELSKEAHLRYDELLRYSVFIEDVRGKSRRGKVVPRLYLRRLLIPHFNLTFSMRDSIELEVNEIEDLLLNPKEFEKKHRLRKGFISDPDQQLLPGIEFEDL